MINLIICVASMDNERLLGFLESLSVCRFKIKITVLVLGTGEDIKLNYFSESINFLNPVVRQIEAKKRWYGEIIEEKTRFINEYADDESIVVLVDDDYYFNLFFTQVIKKIFQENEQVDYLSLLKAGDVICENPIKLSGFDFYHWHSCMGGSVVARWKTFKEDMNDFLVVHGNQHMWDQVFWDFLSEKYGRSEHVYTLYNWSLVQHCNLGSLYRDSTKENMATHSYGVMFDPRINPFKTLGISEINVNFLSGDM